jgi:hypothetical protein
MYLNYENNNTLYPVFILSSNLARLNHWTWIWHLWSMAISKLRTMCKCMSQTGFLHKITKCKASVDSLFLCPQPCMGKFLFCIFTFTFLRRLISFWLTNTLFLQILNHLLPKQGFYLSFSYPQQVDSHSHWIFFHLFFYSCPLRSLIVVSDSKD